MTDKTWVQTVEKRKSISQKELDDKDEEKIMPFFFAPP